MKKRKNIAIPMILAATIAAVSALQLTDRYGI